MQIRQIGTSPLSNVYIGAMWDTVSAMRVQGNLPSSNIHISITKPPTMGTLWNGPAASTSWFTLAQSSNLTYIPYSPMALSNDVFDMRFVYAYSSGASNAQICSPEYRVTLKNWWARFPFISFDPTLKHSHVQHLPLELSDGLRSDGYSWSISDYVVPYGQKASSNASIDIVLAPSSTLPVFHDVLTLTAATMSDPPVVTQSNITISVDESDSVGLNGVDGLNGLLSAVTWSPIMSRDLRFNIVQQPTNGVIYDISSGTPYASFTGEDVATRRIVYQHLGGPGSANWHDSFVVRPSSTPYDITYDSITVNIIVRPMPRVTRNVADYVYYGSSNAALTTAVPISQSFEFVPYDANTNTTYGHVFNSNHIVTEPTFTTNGNYMVAPELVSMGAGGAAQYAPMSMTIALNATPDRDHVNPLSAISTYRDMYLVDWVSYMNRFDSSNVVTTVQNTSNQVISYTFDASAAGYSNLDQRKVSLIFALDPTQNLKSSVTQLDLVKTIDFTVQVNNVHGSNLASFQFVDDTVYLNIVNGSNLQLPVEQSKSITFNKAQKVVIVNNDEHNLDANGNSCLSLYIGYDDAITDAANYIHNAMYGLGISAVDFSDLGKISIHSDILAPHNFQTSNIAVRQAGSDVSYSYNLVNYPTVLDVLSFELTASTFKTGATVQNNTVTTQNIVLGKQIQVRGANNLCIGTNFNTAGTNSIVVGNNIGVTEGGELNEIYQSIVIGTGSFLNSVVRDIISVGNGHMNNLSLSPIDSVNTFLAKRPILIGNDITPDMLDYHVNIANVFMKTSVGTEQIYLGNAAEVVCVGYTSNTTLGGATANATNNTKLFVNGSIAATSISTSYTNGRTPTVVEFDATSVSVSASNVGMVVCMDDYSATSNPISLSTTEMAKTVFGVVSELLTDSKITVVTNGIAQVFVNTNSNIASGDLLTTSAVTGVACKQVDDVIHSYTIGKALSAPVAGFVWIQR
jgi:hypothetical protein